MTRSRQEDPDDEAFKMMIVRPAAVMAGRRYDKARSHRCGPCRGTASCRVAAYQASARPAIPHPAAPLGRVDARSSGAALIGDAFRCGIRP